MFLLHYVHATVFFFPCFKKPPVCAKLLQSCPTLCDPMDYSLTGFSVHGILQARILPSPRGLPNPGNKTTSLTSPALAGGFFTTSTKSFHTCRCCCSFTKSCPTLCDHIKCSQVSMSFTISWSLLKFVSIESAMPSNHLILCHSVLLLSSIFPNIRVFSNELALHIRWSKYQSFQRTPRTDLL